MIWEDKDMTGHSFDFLYYFWLENVYIFNLSQFLSFCQFADEGSLHTVKSQALIANYSMIG